MSLNRTQELTLRALRDSSLVGEDLLTEALLRRGFLAWRDGDGVWLGTGSHDADVFALELVPGLATLRIVGHPERYCRVFLRGTTEDSAAEAAGEVIALGEHHVGRDHGGFSGYGCGLRRDGDYTWSKYAAMGWGAKLPACPAKLKDEAPVYGALDVGIALLVKCLPLARVATALSCDGHGVEPAWLTFCFDWDRPWAQAVFEAVSPAPENSEWLWDGALSIRPRNGFGDESVGLMLDDIQRRARRFLDVGTISKIGAARRETLAAFAGRRAGPAPDEFREVAEQRLAKEFG